jgi:tRNA modification GTPase
MNVPSLAETYVACLTPAGTRAIATVAVRGPKAWEIVRNLFRPSSRSQERLPDAAEVGQIWLGRLGEDVADEVVVSVKAVQPVPRLEVHCHGGREVIRLLLEVFERRGVQTCSWQHFEWLTTGNPIRSTAAVALANARTVRTAAILLDQYQGAFERTLDAVRLAWDRGDRAEVGRELESLARFAKLGRHLTIPWRVVIAGAPNVGKSSLVNALAGYPRCVVSSIPGTTRDVVTTFLAIDGWPLELADTAGFREGGERLERDGVNLARTAAQTADLCLWVLDASAPPVWPDFSMESMQLVVNKVDLTPAWDLDQAVDAVRVSALTNAGLDDLCQSLSRRLVPDVPPPGAALPFTENLCTRIEEAWRHYSAGRDLEGKLAVEAAWQKNGQALTPLL